MNKEMALQLEGLKNKIKKTYEEGVTLEQAEKLAGEFLVAQMKIANDLMNADLDARMKKSGLKAIKAAVYMSEVDKSEKKPSDTLLEQVVNQDKQVMAQSDLLDSAEVLRDALNNYKSIFHEAHIHFRGIAKGRFE